MPNSISIKTEADRKLLFEQYKLVIDSLNKINDIRETSNNFWTGLNGALVSVIAYVKGMQNLGGQPKLFFFMTTIFLGIFLSITWAGYLVTIKKSVDIRDNILIEFEKYFPSKPFTTAIGLMGRKQGKGSLSFKEMRIPILFLVGYLLFAIVLLLYPSIVIS